jgi:hypothetical protein
VLWLMQRWFVPHSYRQLIPQLLVGGLVYGLCVGWAYWSDRALHTGDLSLAASAVELEALASGVEVLPDDV